MPAVIHLIRHGQSTFNAHYEATGGEDPLHFDARLSELGQLQAKETGAALADRHYDLVIASPLTRAIQTAIGIFGSRVPITIDALHREWLNSSCDIGRPGDELAREFPMLRFDHLDNPWWHVEGPKSALGWACEPEPVLLARVAAFKTMIAARPEQRIAVIGHGDFFFRLVGRQMKNCELVEWAI